MSKIDEFKDFVSNKPELINYVKSGEMTWQKFYEIYDLYGEDENAWKDYRNDSPSAVSKITDLLHNVDLNEVKEHISTAQKALDIVQELTSKTANPIKNIAKPSTISKFFED